MVASHGIHFDFGCCNTLRAGYRDTISESSIQVGFPRSPASLQIMEQVAHLAFVVTSSTFRV